MAISPVSGSCRSSGSRKAATMSAGSSVPSGRSSRARTVAPTTTSDAPETTEATVDAAALYAENCAGCHADGVSGSASEIETIVDDGADEMPAFGEKLSAEEVAALAAYAAEGGK